MQPCPSRAVAGVTPALTLPAAIVSACSPGTAVKDWYFRFLPVRNVRLSAPATKTDHRGGAGTQSPELFLAKTLSCQNCLGGGTTHPGAPAKQGGQGRKIWAGSKAERIAAAETRPPALQLEQDGEEKAFLI